jgi:hypothetical protein
MKTHLLLVCFFCIHTVSAQITTPATRAGFGVDADLRANFTNGFVQSGSDDWFGNGTPGTGQLVIDTAGAYRMMSRFATDPAYRRLPFFRTMRVPQFSLVNNRLWIDAVYIRDYNGQSGGDSTAFVLSNKNGDSPENWRGGVTSVLDKNDIAEMMLHVRRAGSQRTDSLWMMGGISLQGTNGNRYFDFELYQTDIFYNRATGQFCNYGPHEGHTAWKFDEGGNVISPGDVIFTAEFSSSSLTNIEARIWVDRADLLMAPVGFDWIGDFVGASNASQFGYANIRPKSSGAYYTGMQSGNNTWAGPFGFIDGGNNLQTTYSARQYMEFSVNLTKLGLDPITLLGGSACGLPFRRILVKTRTSTSFSSELKDFIGPFDFFAAPPVQAVADVPIYCGVIGASEISVINPASASVYTWSTPDGHIVTNPNASSITVDAPGTYIVAQQLLDGCSNHAYDTVVITYDAACVPMENKILSFRGQVRGREAQVHWQTRSNDEILYFELERSADGRLFESVNRIDTRYAHEAHQSYSYTDDIGSVKSASVFYRLRYRHITGALAYSPVLKLSRSSEDADVQLFPNPANGLLQLAVNTPKRQETEVRILSPEGRLVRQQQLVLQEGVNVVPLDVTGWRQGLYLVSVRLGDSVIWRKLLVAAGGR